MKDEILSYRDMCNRIHVNTIQRGMNYHIKRSLSVILMSVRPGSPYNDEIDIKSNLLIYEGHDVPKSKQTPYPKLLDQSIWNDKGTLTENGKFVKAVERFKRKISSPEKILVFEKLGRGIWSEKGIFDLIDYQTKESNGRKVFRFILRPTNEDIKIPKHEDESRYNRLIPTSVKLKVWKRDKGKCVLCGSRNNLHYDHDIPYSKGGSSITEKNIRILCATCNIRKKDKIE